MDWRKIRAVIHAHQYRKRRIHREDSRMKKFLSLAIFALLACISTFAQTPPGGYGPSQGGNSTATIVAVSQNGPPGVVNPYAYGAKYNAHFNAAPSFTNTLNTVNCAGCNFTGTDALGGRLQVSVRLSLARTLRPMFRKQPLSSSRLSVAL